MRNGPAFGKNCITSFPTGRSETGMYTRAPDLPGASQDSRGPDQRAGSSSATSAIREMRNIRLDWSDQIQQNYGPLAVRRCLVAGLASSINRHIVGGELSKNKLPKSKNLSHAIWVNILLEIGGGTIRSGLDHSSSAVENQSINKEVRVIEKCSSVEW